MDEFELFAIFLKSVDMNEAGGAGSRADYHILTSANNEEGLIVLTRKGNSGDADSGFVILQVDPCDCSFSSHWVYDLDTRGPMTGASWVAKLFRRQSDSITVDYVRVVEQFGFCSRGEDVVIRFDDVE